MEFSIMSIINLGSNRELFVDNYLIDNISGSSLKLHQPLPGGVAIKYDQPWETNDNYNTICSGEDVQWCHAPSIN